MDQPRLGVIIPAYNAQDTIIRSIESIYKQDYENWKIYVVNDGSHDLTGIILDDLAMKDNRIHVIHIENGGKRNAHKIAIEAAVGCDFITFLDSDDMFIADNLFTVCMAECNNENADIVVFNIERDGRKIFQIDRKICISNMKDKVKEMLCQKIIDGNICGAFYKYEIVQTGYVIRKYNHEDYVNKYNFLKLSKKVLVLPIIGYKYIRQSGSITQKCIKEEEYFYYLNALEFVNKLKLEFSDIETESEFFLGNILLWTAEKLEQNKCNKKLRMYKPIVEMLSNYRSIVLYKCPYFSIRRKMLFILLQCKIYYPLYVIRLYVQKIKRKT